jgi:hypothetical protein
MPRSTRQCGAETVSGGTCRNKVSNPGERCRVHRRALDPKRILSLCFSVTEKIVAVCTVYEAAEKLYPMVMPIVHSLQGLGEPDEMTQL